MAKFYLPICTIKNRRDENQGKEAGNDPSEKKQVCLDVRITRSAKLVGWLLITSLESRANKPKQTLFAFLSPGSVASDFEALKQRERQRQLFRRRD